MPSDFDPAGIESLRSLGGPSLLAEVIGLFLEHAPKRIAEARRGLAEGDWALVERAGHSLKSSAAQLGLTSMSASARLLESLAREGRIAGIPEVLDELDHALERRRPDLEAFVRQG